MLMGNNGVLRVLRVDSSHCGRIAAFSCGLFVLTTGACSATTEGAEEEQVSQAAEALVAPSAAVWVAQGPGPMLNGQASTWPTTDKNPVAGAIQAVATHPTNANIVYAGAINGGVWKTSNALAQTPSWTALTDKTESLSIGAIALDRTNPNTVVAATGLWSSYGSSPARPNEGVSQGQIFLSKNAGGTWAVLTNSLFANQKASSVIVRGNAIVAGFLDTVGLVRSSDLGAHWTRISASGVGLPAGAIDDVTEDIQNANRLYLTSSRVGVFRSDDLGQHWVNISQNDVGDTGLNNNILNFSDAAKVRVSQDGRAYVGIVGLPNHDGIEFVSYVGYTGDGGAHWTAMDAPFLEARGKPYFHFSMAVDRTNSSFVYIGGVADPMRGRAYIAPGNGQQWESMVTTTPHGTWPHVDARNMAIDANLNLIETSDGGLFRRTRPSESTTDWASMAGNLQTAEIASIAYDPVARVLLAGTQDNGTVYQNGTNQLAWNTFLPDDGADVQVETITRPGFSVRYSSGQFLMEFTRSVWNSSNVLQSRATPALSTGDGSFFQPQFLSPIAINAVNGNRILIGALDAVYESSNQGDLVGSLGSGANATALVYGHPTNADVIYAAAGGQIYMRPLGRAPLFPMTPIPNCNAKDVVMDASDWQVAYALCDSAVYKTSDTGDTWTSITGNLFSQSPNPGTLRKVRFISGVSKSYVAVGADRGVFVATTTALGTWSKVGSNLPIAPVLAMQYSRSRDILAVGTLGRGAWSVNGLGGP
jgi:photosystem II stability/assembly factor-like uncharacterized protein